MRIPPVKGDASSKVSKLTLKDDPAAYSAEKIDCINLNKKPLPVPMHLAMVTTSNAHLITYEEEFGEVRNTRNYLANLAERPWEQRPCKICRSGIEEARGTIANAVEVFTIPGYFTKAFGAGRSLFPKQCRFSLFHNCCSIRLCVMNKLILVNMHK